jgi:hypothetical protein
MHGSDSVYMMLRCHIGVLCRFAVAHVTSFCMVFAGLSNNSAIVDGSVEDLQAMLDVNILGVFRICKVGHSCSFPC